jgi:ribosome-binding protein aMBF1 (putative translation factor)
MVKKTKNGLAILQRLIGDSPGVRRGIERERQRADIAQQIHDARVEAGLSQRQLAGLVGTTQSVIARLEDADYPGHSLRMLQRIARALDRTLHVELRRSQPAASASSRGRG